MYILFDEAGKLQTGRLLSEAESSVQVELDTGKRVKVKAANTLLRFEKPAPAQLMPVATDLAESMELDLAYEFAPGEEFGFDELARDYFSEQASTEQLVATMLCLHGAPHYFRRAGKGRFRKAPPDILAQALAAIEKKKQVQARIESWAGELLQGRCPAEVREQLYRILFKPDKNAPEYKAVVEAARQGKLAPLTLLEQAGAITSAYEFHWQRFLFEQFPKGTGFPVMSVPAMGDDLPLAGVQAFSIDDSHTTEIDDALSLQGLGSGSVILGIHIAAPGLAITPDDALDQIARQRLSTVYMPGHKVTMLPDAVVQAYTLEAGRACPAVSLYLTIDEASLTVTESRTALERVPIATNLRHDQLDEVITPAWLAGDTSATTASADVESLRPTLGFLYRLAQHLKAQREQVRGKPETFNRPDYSFRLEGVKGSQPDGSETVHIGTRRRGEPMDLIVRHLPQPGQPGTRRQGAHGHQGTTPCGHWRALLCLEHLTSAPLRGSGQPVADHRLCPLRQDRCPRSPLQAQGRQPVLGGERLRRCLQCLQPVPERHGTLLDPALPAAGADRRTHRHPGARQPRSGRHAASGVARPGNRRAAPGGACADPAGDDRRDRPGGGRHRHRAPGSAGGAGGDRQRR